MKNFNIKVIREDEYKIEVDPAVWDKKTRNEFESVFWPVPDLEDVAKSLAQAISQKEPGAFYEGFGHVLTFKKGKELGQFKRVNGHTLKRSEGDYCRGIIVHVISHDDEYGVELLFEEPCQP